MTIKKQIQSHYISSRRNAGHRLNTAIGDYARAIGDVAGETARANDPSMSHAESLVIRRDVEERVKAQFGLSLITCKSIIKGLDIS